MADIEKCGNDVANKDDVITQTNSSSNEDYEKILYVSSETKGNEMNGLLAALIQYTNIGNALSNIERTAEYVVQIPLKYRKAFEEGKLFLNQNSKTAVTWPTLYKRLENGKRQFVDNLPIKQQEMVYGNPFERIAVSYHNLYMQQQIGELAEIMTQTYRIVERIEQGQMDDRVGLLLSGRDQILFSMHADPQDRGNAIEFGRSNMLTAQKQLLLTFKRRVGSFKPIPQSCWKRFWMEVMHTGALRQIDKDFSDIQQYYALYLQATKLIASSYAICGLPEAVDHVYAIAEQDMREVNFESLKTLQYIHEKNNDMLYYHADDYIAAERAISLDNSKEYDLINIELNGVKLLEVFGNG